ncbi:hypothetical protein [Brevibacillus fulvus]|uniref:Molybdopterin converting factor small subunit n=1 Tax=Brevibacillus fulvus TaxID=1125967 RepID=A0A938Y414_9BACL|nr:hypothetical protein [Brevibacillus fulvus]MBM7591192.1 molybdopterin converting factor small subunit [Brevibacillus fulvus]
MGRGPKPMDAQDRRQSDSQVIERLARMEEQLKQVPAIKTSIDQLMAALASLNAVYLPRTESQALNMAREQQLKNLEDKIAAQDKRLEKVEGNLTWVTRAVLLLVIGAVVGGVIVTKGG